MKDLIQAHLSDLKNRTYDELLKLNDYQAEKVKINDKLFSVAVWKDAISESELMIVVQVYRHWFLGIGKMDADGFVINNIGETRCLKKAEVYDFL